LRHFFTITDDALATALRQRALTDNRTIQTTLERLLRAVLHNADVLNAPTAPPAHTPTAPTPAPSPRTKSRRRASGTEKPQQPSNQQRVRQQPRQRPNHDRPHTTTAPTPAASGVTEKGLTLCTCGHSSLSHSPLSARCFFKGCTCDSFTTRRAARGGRTRS